MPFYFQAFLLRMQYFHMESVQHDDNLLSTVDADGLGPDSI